MSSAALARPGRKASSRYGKFCQMRYSCLLSRESLQVPTRNISLTDEQDAFVEKVVRSGEYQNASEAFRAALRILQQRREEDALRLKALRAQLKAGVDALDSGEFVEVSDEELEAFLQNLPFPTSKAGP